MVEKRSSYYNFPSFCESLAIFLSIFASEINPFSQGQIYWRFCVTPTPFVNHCLRRSENPSFIKHKTNLLSIRVYHLHAFVRIHNMRALPNGISPPQLMQLLFERTRSLISSSWRRIRRNICIYIYICACALHTRAYTYFKKPLRAKHLIKCIIVHTGWFFYTHFSEKSLYLHLWKIVKSFSTSVVSFKCFLSLITCNFFFTEYTDA